MNKKLLLAVIAILVPLSALQAMTVAAFLEKADALKARGMMAMFSSDIGLLKGEIQGAGRALRAEVEGAQRAGRRPAFCPPPRGQTSMTSTELLAFFRSIPPAQRQRVEVRDGLRAMMIRRYPCRQG